MFVYLGFLGCPRFHSIIYFYSEDVLDQIALELRLEWQDFENSTFLT